MAATDASSATQCGEGSRPVERRSVPGSPALALLGRGSTADLHADIFDAAQRLDPRKIRRGLDRATATIGLAGCIDDVLLPVLRQVQRWRADGRCDVDQERMATEASRAWLDSRSAFSPPPRQPDPILLACGPRDQHTVDLEALTLLLRVQGWPCRVLGARASVFDLSTATRATGPVAVVVFSHLDADRSQAVTAINTVSLQGHPVFYAGDAFAHPAARESVAGDYLGDSMQTACGRLVQALSTSEPSRG